MPRWWAGSAINMYPKEVSVGDGREIKVRRRMVHFD